MSQVEQIFLTSGLTILGGIIVIVIGQIIIHFVIEPIQELNKIVGEIAAYVFKSHSLLADIPDPNKEELKIAADKLQDLSAKLRAAINAIPYLTSDKIYFLSTKNTNRIK